MDRNDIILREAEGPSPRDLLRDLIQAVDNLFTPASDGAGKWLQGKGEAELAKAAEIKARVLTTIASIDHEREKLIQAREQSVASLHNEHERNRMGHQEQMFHLQTERMRMQAECLKSVVDSLQRLRELGVEVSMEQVRIMLEPPRVRPLSVRTRPRNESGSSP
jgi:hypothetical protein